MRQNKSRWRKITIQSQGILLQIQFQCLSVQRQFTAGLDCCAILVCNFMLTIFPQPWLSETFIFKGTRDFSFWLLPAWLTSVFPSRTELTCWAKQDAALHLLCPRTLSARSMWRSHKALWSSSSCQDHISFCQLRYSPWGNSLLASLLMTQDLTYTCVCSSMKDTVPIARALSPHHPPGRLCYERLTLTSS